MSRRPRFSDDEEEEDAEEDEEAENDGDNKEEGDDDDNDEVDERVAAANWGHKSCTFGSCRHNQSAKHTSV
jgi:hypothetical protein